MTLWGTNHTMIRVISTPTVSYIIPHFLQCKYGSTCVAIIIDSPCNQVDESFRFCSDESFSTYRDLQAKVKIIKD